MLMKKRSKKLKPDWTEIETVYVSGNMSLSKLADDVGVSESAMNRASGRGGWVRKRQEYRRKVTGLSIQKQLGKDVLDKAHFDLHVGAITDVIIKESADSILKAREEKTLTTEGMEKHIDLADKSLQVKYRILGIPPPKSAQAMDAENSFKHYQECLAAAQAKLNKDVLTGKVKLIKRAKGGSKTRLNPNDIIEISVTEPYPETESGGKQ